jgi:hypothetical protein
MDSQGEDEAAKIELTYSIPRGINRAKPTLRTLVVCIIQVIRSVQSRASDWASLAPPRMDLDVVVFYRQRAVHGGGRGVGTLSSCRESIDGDALVP